MIIMIKDYEAGLHKWHTWDHIDRVIEFPIRTDMDNYDNFKEMSNRYYIIVPENQIAKDPTIKHPILKMGVLACFKENPEKSIKIFFNTEAYICNDDGRTIKRIIVYPREQLT